MCNVLTKLLFHVTNIATCCDMLRVVTLRQTDYPAVATQGLHQTSLRNRLAEIIISCTTRMFVRLPFAGRPTDW